MRDQCRHCGAARVVPVFDKQIDKDPRPGNAYRQFCLACERWLPLCSKERFKSHSNPHVLPIRHDRFENNPIPLSEYDYEPEWTALAEKVRNESGRETDDRGHTSTSVSDRMKVLKGKAVSLVDRSDDGDDTTGGNPPELAHRSNPGAVSETLRELEQLESDGVISSSEYAEQKTKMLDRL